VDIPHSIGQKLLEAFDGKEPTPEIIEALRNYRPAGLTLFRSLNIENPTQVRRLTDSLQRLTEEFDLPPLLIATDQEGGQLMAVGEGTTQLPGNMALGATGSPELARKAGEVLGLELAAMGINVNYAPSCDVNINPQNPVIGIRSFGENPEVVARLACAMIEGIQLQGVAATAKHFPGHGDTAGDSHHGLPSVPHSLERLEQVEFPPFRAAIDADAKLVMTAHLALPSLDGPDAPPATLSRRILHGLLREELNFKGVIVTDAMDMGAIHQGEALGEDAVRAVAAGADLLLLTSNPDDQQCVYNRLLSALRCGELNPEAVTASVERILALKRWLAGRSQPDLSVVGCATHQAVAAEIAERSITLVRDSSGLLPLRVKPDQHIAVVLPKPIDLTPADTSSYVTPKLAAALRCYHPNIDEFTLSYTPEPDESAGLFERLRDYNILILGTLNAYASPDQAEFVRQALKLGIPSVVVALRLPYDLAVFPEAGTYMCTYSILEPSMQALVKALFGEIKFEGRLPVSIPNLYKMGHGIIVETRAGWGLGKKREER
jgi:beta-N-acetylhexosaminidase